MIYENSRLEELLKLKDEIEAEIEAIQDQDILDDTLEEMTEDLLEELIEEDRCPHCVVKEFLKAMYEIGYEDAILNIEEN